MRLIHGDSLQLVPTLGLDPARTAVVTDPPWGMGNDTDSTRFSGGSPKSHHRRDGGGRNDWPEVRGDDEPFDPSPWLGYGKVILWGANHFAARLPVGTTLVWIKRKDSAFGSFLSDGEIAWQKGGRGVFFHRELPGYDNANRVHPNQKPVGLMRWCIGRLKIPPDWTILDPYLGSGATAIAALEMGYDFVGIELSGAYFAAAERRVREAKAYRDGVGGPLFASLRKEA